MAESGSAPAAPAAARLLLVLPDGMRMPLRDTVTIGRGEGVTVKLDDRTVSRMHCRISPGPQGPVIEDAGSRFGVIVSGAPVTGPRPLVSGSEIRLGNVVLRVESETPLPAVGEAAGPGAPDAGPHATIVVPVGATQMGLRAAPAMTDGSLRPRLRSGYALKRLDDAGADKPFVLRDLKEGGAFLRLDEGDAQLLALLDGQRTIAELLAEATTLLGPAGPGRLARLVADFGERGLLDGIAPVPRVQPEPGVLARAFKPREKTFAGLGDYFVAAYRHWGRAFFSPLTVTALALLSLAGLVIFAYLVGARYGTPFVVAHRLLVGGAVFIAGRFFIVTLHELAHGLALAHYGRRTNRAGIRLMFIFPYAFVDTNEAYFESRGRRIVVSLAGPVTDFSLAALFSVLCAVSPRGNVRDVLFQLAFAGYVGAFFNANPFLDRDGYQILSEWLREPGLRQRARAQMRQRLSGAAPGGQGSAVLGRYAVAGLVWSVIGAGFVAVLSLRYYDRLSVLAPKPVVTTAFIVFFAVLLAPVVVSLGAPLFGRARHGTAEVNRVIK